MLRSAHLLPLAILLTAGCGLLLDPDPIRMPRDGGRPPVDIGVGVVYPPLGCGDPMDDATVALFRMNGLASGVLVDETGRHDGDILGGAAEETEGPMGCGPAMVTGNPIYGVVPPSPEFQLARGSVDMWVKLDPGRASCETLLSRDAEFSERSGHFSIFAGSSNRIGLRLQSLSDQGSIVVFADDGAPVDTWFHVGVNFGPEGVELFVDGVPKSGGIVGDCSDARGDACTGPDCTTGIDGNDNPFTVAVGSTASTEGTADSVRDYLSGAIDELRISSARRDFASR